MRALLEYLGIVRPNHARREPVALPASFRRFGLILAAVLAVASTLALAILRAALA